MLFEQLFLVEVGQLAFPRNSVNLYAQEELFLF